MKVLPWALCVALVIIVTILFLSDQKQQSELVALRQANQELEQRASNTTNQAPASANDELTRLRTENQDVLRLRNEVRQLREENKQFQGQVQAAQAQVQSVQAQADQLRNTAAQATAQAQQLEAANRAQAQNQANATSICIANLRQLDGATQQWALENRKQANSPVTLQDILPYLRDKSAIKCPAGGAYNLSTVSAVPTCTIPGHVLTKL